MTGGTVTGRPWTIYSDDGAVLCKGGTRATAWSATWLDDLSFGTPAWDPAGVRYIPVVLRWNDFDLQRSTVDSDRFRALTKVGGAEVFPSGLGFAPAGMPSTDGGWWQTSLVAEDLAALRLLDLPVRVFDLEAGRWLD